MKSNDHSSVSHSLDMMNYSMVNLASIQNEKCILIWYQMPNPCIVVHSLLRECMKPCSNSHEYQNLVNDGVLEPVGATEHAYPTFIVPKKDGRVRWVSDLFCKLNAQLWHNV
jgi:hypothetical protein